MAETRDEEEGREATDGLDRLDLLEAQIERINRFPDQNPNPVMRMSDAGRLLYANSAGAGILRSLGIGVGDDIPTDVLAGLRRALDPDHGSATIEVASGVRTFALLPVAVPEFGFVNIYGTDVTAEKVVARFPDENPNPVLRIGDDRRLLYANRASRSILEGLRVGVGDLLPDDLAENLIRSADDDAGERVEIAFGGRSFALVPVRIPELGFVNVYGTDITALKAINRFPDANPHPVLRVSRAGVLTYANPASEPIVRSLGLVVGKRVPEAFLGEVLARVETRSTETIEVRIESAVYSILVVAVYEFSSINLYGTDVTAARQWRRPSRERATAVSTSCRRSIADAVARRRNCDCGPLR